LSGLEGSCPFHFEQAAQGGIGEKRQDKPLSQLACLVKRFAS
jgi:hypothetical protein